MSMKVSVKIGSHVTWMEDMGTSETGPQPPEPQYGTLLRVEGVEGIIDVDCGHGKGYIVQVPLRILEPAPEEINGR